MSAPSPSSKHEKKKQVEKHYLENFLSNWSPASRVVRAGQDNGQEPDFYADVNGSEVGIELRRIFKEEGGAGSLNRERERYQYETCAEIAKAYYEMFEIPIHVNFMGSMPNRQEIEQAAHELGVVASTLQELSDENDAFTLPAAGKVYIRRLPCNQGLDLYSRWQVGTTHMGWSRKLSTELLQSCVDSKASKITGYRNGAAQVLLLLYSDRTSESGMFHLPPDLSPVTGRGFDSVFLYLYPEDGIHRLDKQTTILNFHEE